MDHKTISKNISYALRHDPKSFGLTLDEHGWADIDKLLHALSRRFGRLTVKDIEHIIEISEKKRFEISGDKIRAYYGHSIQQEIIKDPMPPPEYLYHGTARDTVKLILREGLKPMSRQKVHLSTDHTTARKTGLRKSRDVVILRISALKAHQDGYKFYPGNQDVWLCDDMPPAYITGGE